MSNIDPTGLVKWSGTSFSSAAATFFYDRYQLKSECVNGVRYFVQVEAKGLGFGIGWPLSATGGGVDFHDNNSTPDPQVFNGLYIKAGGGAAAGVGIGTSTILMGNATSDPGISPSFGIDFSFGVGRGNAKVVSVVKDDCCQ